ncbi:MAG: hypothetical protein P1U68_01045 [Verrucomicrobiales bacterium]|nr:hypothetical protein [Verrucomicrobiales bacterium]
MNPSDRKDQLLANFLSGDISAELLSELAVLAKEDSRLAEKLGGELEFAEMIRQVLTDGPERSETLFRSAKDAFEQSPETLVARVCEGEITSAEGDQLAKHLLDSPAEIASVKRYLAEEEWIREAVAESRSEAAFIEALETRMWAETTRDHFVDDLEDRLVREFSGAGEENGKVVEMPVSWTPTVLKMAAIAAAVAVGAFFIAQQGVERLPANSSLAIVTKASVDAKWAGDLMPGAKGEVKSGIYELEKGIVALTFAAGGEMTVEGPAKFEVKDDATAHVFHGVAMARNSPANAGITLQSKGLSVTEPVPLIGIDARSEYSTDAIVFEGDGGVCLQDGGCRSLFKLEAVKADLTREKLVDIPYNPQPFLGGWELLSGVEKNLGSVRIEMPGSEIKSTDQEGEVQVFVENESFRPEFEMEVDQIQVGQFAAAEANPGQALQSRGELRSYLLQLWPTNGVDGEEVEASLTFDHEVVGLIYSSDRLTSSDQSVGTSLAHVGAEFNRGRGLDMGSDEILLSDDRHTLNLKLKGGTLEVDQIRVLVALN